VSVFGVLAFVVQGLGLLLVITGLYRRDPAAQRRWAMMRGHLIRWMRRLLRRPPPKVVGRAVSSMVGLRSSARGTVRPGRRKEDSSHDERLDWLEHAVDVAFRELDAEAAYRAEDIAELRTKLSAVESTYREDVSELRRLLDEAGIPERMEWWGAALVFLGLVFSILGATLGSTSAT
jgi:hypothetical protein